MRREGKGSIYRCPSLRAEDLKNLRKGRLNRTQGRFNRLIGQTYQNGLLTKGRLNRTLGPVQPHFSRDFFWRSQVELPLRQVQPFFLERVSNANSLERIELLQTKFEMRFSKQILKSRDFELLQTFYTFVRIPLDCTVNPMTQEKVNFEEPSLGNTRNTVRCMNQVLVVIALIRVSSSFKLYSVYLPNLQ